MNEFDVEARALSREVGALAQDLRRALAAVAGGPFSAARDFRFTNSTRQVREWLGRCATLLHEAHPNYPALYSELNGFDINPDRWFVSLMAWTRPIPQDASPLDWDGHAVDLHYREDLTLTGAQAMQDAFEWWSPVAERQETTAEVDRACALAQWLVWSEWLVLLHDAWADGPISGIGVPLVATAHDFEISVRFEPQEWSVRR